MRTNMTTFMNHVCAPDNKRKLPARFSCVENGHTARDTLCKTSARHHVVRTWSLARSTVPAVDRRRHPCVDDETDYTEMWAERERLGECSIHCTCRRTNAAVYCLPALVSAH